MMVEHQDFAQPRIGHIWRLRPDPRGCGHEDTGDWDTGNPQRPSVLRRTPAQDATNAEATVFQRHEERVARSWNGSLRRLGFRPFPGHDFSRHQTWARVIPASL